jgi:U3 small nucleolar ribonucleoprotein component
VNGKQEMMEVMKDMHQFQNRIKIAFVVYDKFYELDRFIESGINGDGAFPDHTNRKDLPDREKGT